MLITGVLEIELHIPAAQSLKQKRSVVKSLRDRLRSNFNISVAEIDHLDKWQRATLAIAMVSRDQQYLDSRFQAITGFIETEILASAYVVRSELMLL